MRWYQEVGVHGSESIDDFRDEKILEAKEFTSTQRQQVIFLFNAVDSLVRGACWYLEPNQRIASQLTILRLQVSKR